MQLPDASSAGANQLQLVMAYVAELELEVDRLRRRDQFVQHAAREHVRQTTQLCHDAGPNQNQENALAAVVNACDKFRELLRDVHEPSGYHPAFDQVIAIAVRPLAEQVFRCQQRLSGARNAVLHLDLQPEHIDWFPARLRHILDNLVAEALRHCRPSQTNFLLSIALRVLDDGYELQVTDDGAETPGERAAGMRELFHRSAPSRAAGLDVGLAVVSFLVEDCCGTISVNSNEGQGTVVTIVLPRYDLDDHVD